MDSCTYLFKQVAANAENYPKICKNPNGQHLWQSCIKKVLKEETEHIVASKWNSIDEKTVDDIMNLPEYYIDGHGIKKIIETNHFLIQQVRIPKIESPTLRKIIQIALNIGFWKGYFNEERETMNQKYRYHELQLDQLETYISKEDIKKISLSIPKSTVNRIMNNLQSY